ncbi:hypothetical protein QJS83_16120 [Bdellovibrio sp. 22V]|uniref:DUF883 family protein n=1 Tax=Bdellovibrio TaxID=958 RepID=UPI0025431139|nr:hypothetical protein [Bdellovibrio sp. 22V]WII71990.1 hypothetical protein QJS83_16120 [Bdellovibrio sp. 22V]
METTPNDYRSNLGNIKENIKENISQELSRSQWNERFQDLKSKANDAVGASEDMLKSHPFYSVLGAAAIGFVAGLMIRRRH